jgi:hypothetical protein
LKAQERISGAVKDVGGMPLPSVTVLQKGKANSSIMHELAQNEDFFNYFSEKRLTKHLNIFNIKVK